MVSMSILIAVVFIAGFGWGQWYEAWRAKRELSKRDEHKLTISMPMKGEDAEAVVSLLKNLIRQAREDGLIGEEKK